MQIKYFRLIYILIFLIINLHGQIYSTYESDTLVVTGNRIPTGLAEISRNVKVIGSDKIRQINAQSLDELLSKSTTGDLQSRGPGGVQTDVKLRGSSFNQVLILIDGMKVNDPQTGHHNLNLPITTSDIEKIEVLKGAGSRLYGPNALGGVINIITKRSNQAGTNIKLAAGENNYLNKTLSMVVPIAKTVNRISYSNRSSNGYRYNTDYNISTLFFRSALNSKAGHFSLTGGITDKDFGANEFYTPGSYPDQRENTRAMFLGLSHFIKPDWGKVTTKVAGRQHDDRFILDHTLDSDDPGYYQNDHRTRTYSAGTQATIASEFYKINLGLEIGREKINSNSLGEHSRNRIGFYVEGKSGLSSLAIVPGVSVFYYSDWEWIVSPGLDLKYDLFGGLSITGSIGRSFSPPTYTNLYYQSPVNSGNPNLKPEEAWSYETGLKYRGKYLTSNFDIFYRRNKNLIDYAWEDEHDIYIARNVNNFDIYGSEISLSLSEAFSGQLDFLHDLQFSYTLLKGSRNVDYKSKYVFNYLEHQACLNIAHPVFWKVNSNWSLRYKDYIKSNSYLIIDWNAQVSLDRYNLYLKVDNLFDKAYREFGYLPMPGRWITFGAEMRI